MNIEEELQKAYRCIVGLSNHIRENEHSMPKLEDAMMAYHLLTIGAARRYVYEGQLDGSEYFIGKHISVLQNVLEQTK